MELETTNCHTTAIKATNQVVAIKKKNPAEWMALLAKVETQHWRKLRLTIQIREKMYGGKPAQLDAAKAMLRARGLEDAIEAVNVNDPTELKEAAEKTVDEGLCQFHQREDKPGVWWPSNNFKACLKENWGALGYRMDATPRSKRGKSEEVEETKDKNKKKETPKARTIKGSRGALAEGVFVVSTDPLDRDWIRLGDKPDGIDTAVAHTTGPMGPQASIKRNEYMVRPKFEVEVWISVAVLDRIPDESFADVLKHACEHGIGANRSQGFGKFDVIEINEID